MDLEGEMVKKNKIAIIILNYKSWGETVKEADLCNDLLHIDYKDIVIVDNASPNNSAEMLERERKNRNYVFLKSNTNAGYAAGNNIGMRYAYNKGYKYAWILNNDIIIDDVQIITKIIDVFEKDSSVAVVNPDIYAPDGHMFNRDAKKPTFFDYTIGANKYRKNGRQIQDLGGYAYIYRPQGCCMMVDLEKMDEVDYMDEHTFLYVEEPILAERLLKKKYRCACCFHTQIIHNHSTTVKSVFAKNKIRKMNNESFKYYLKKYRRFNSLQIEICCFFNYIKLILLG